MVTLNTLRTKFGIVLSAVIAFALLAFVFSLKSEMGFSGNDPIVVEIDGQGVSYSEYLNEYNYVQRLSGVSEIDEQQAQALYDATWRSLISKQLLQPGVAELGLSISEAERMAIIRGEIPTQTLYSVFGNPTTGVYDLNVLNSFLLTSQGNAEAEQMWAMLVSQALIERSTTKYGQLANLGVNLNDMEVANGVEAANKSFSGRWAIKRYSTVADSLVSVSQSEIKKYYDDNKSQYKRDPFRSVSYVEFNIDPSNEDKAAIETSAKELGARFAEANDLRSFVRENRSGSIAANYVSEAGLPAAAVSALVAGGQYGPVEVNNSWSMSRVENSLFASDTLTVSHIVLSYTDEKLADSLLVALRKGGDADFAAAAEAHSIYTETAQLGGFIGATPFSAFTDEFATSLAPVRKGDIVKIESGDVIQLVKATAVGPRIKHYRLATIEIPIVESQATRTAAYNAAGIFVGEAKGGADNFKSAAAKNSVAPHSANLTSAMRSVPAVSGSQEIARWAHRAKVGDLSEIFKVNDGYVVACLTGINDDEYSSLSEVESRIRRTLMSEKKFEVLKSQVSGSTFEQMVESVDATTGEFTDISFASFYIAGVGVEPRLIGSIANSEVAVVSAPIKGSNALCFYVVDDITESEEPQTAEAEKLRAELNLQQMLQQMLFGTMESMAEVKDLRGRSF